MGSGGPRENSGRPKTAFGFRSWCRDIAKSEKVQKAIQERAETDPEFALKVAEHGFGRPPQALDVTVAGDPNRPIEYVVELADGRAAIAEAPALPRAVAAGSDS